MTFTVTLRQSGRQFQVEPDEPILAAALRQNVELPYGCKSGACGVCKSAITRGKIEQHEHAAFALPDDESARGLALLCCASAKSDIEIDVPEVNAVNAASDTQPCKLPCRISTIERKSADVIILKLQLPAGEKVPYRAGQYLQFILPDDMRRCYSMATPPRDDGTIELHIRHLPGGRFTDQVFGSLKERDILRCEIPFGTFFLREDSQKPIVLLASGTGFAPIKAIVEHIVQRKITRPIAFYWGGRRRSDLYLFDLAVQWAKEIPDFRFVPVLSEPDASDDWTGRTGFVHRAVIEDLRDLSGYQVYACGVPVMVESARRDFTQQHGLPENEFYADAFMSKADLARPA